jgi:hypothetical protein
MCCISRHDAVHIQPIVAPLTQQSSRSTRTFSTFSYKVLCTYSEMSSSVSNDNVVDVDEDWSSLLSFLGSLHSHRHQCCCCCCRYKCLVQHACCQPRCCHCQLLSRCHSCCFHPAAMVFIQYTNVALCKMKVENSVMLVRAYAAQSN